MILFGLFFSMLYACVDELENKPVFDSPTNDHGDGFTESNGDCNDNEASINPNTIWYIDSDGDGYGNPSLYQTDCEQPAGYVGNQQDCDDSNPENFPGAIEVCDGHDNNCNDRVDEGLIQVFYIDFDRDGYGDPLSSVELCELNEETVANGDDCDDSEANAFPGSAENQSLSECMLDADDDGYGDIMVEFPVTVGSDCDDSDPNTFPNSGYNEDISSGLTEACLTDGDLDGFLSTALGGTDCDDENAFKYPGAAYNESATACLKDADGDGYNDCAFHDCDYVIQLSNDIGMDFVEIDVSGGDPLGRYTLTNNFYLMTTEITQGMLSGLMSYYNVTDYSDCYGVGDNYPAYYANWYEFAAFANALSTAEGLTECYTCSGSGTSIECEEHSNYNAQAIYTCPGYRLPTQAEWELAVRSGTTSEFWTGEGAALGGDFISAICEIGVTIEDGANNPLLDDYAWFCGNNSYGFDGVCGGSDYGTQEVGQKLPNGFGLYDMHGNVYEWMQDRYNVGWPTQSVDPVGILGESRVLRGGGWRGFLNRMQASYHSGHAPINHVYRNRGARFSRTNL